MACKLSFFKDYNAGLLNSVKYPSIIMCVICVCVCVCFIDVGIFDFLESVTTPKIMYRFSSNRNLNQRLVPHKNPKNPVLSSEFIESVQSKSPHDEAEQVLSMSDNDKKTKKTLLSLYMNTGLSVLYQATRRNRQVIGEIIGLLMRNNLRYVCFYLVELEFIYVPSSRCIVRTTISFSDTLVNVLRVIRPLLSSFSTDNVNIPQFSRESFVSVTDAEIIKHTF